jgi:hypothetical protein
VVSKRHLTVVSAWIGKTPIWLESIVQNHKTFADRHKYGYEFLTGADLTGFEPLQLGTSLGYSWLKVEAVRLALRSSDYVFWIDADSAFVDHHQSLRDVLPMRASLTFTGDSNDLCNAGHLLFRNSRFTWDFLDRWERLRYIPFPALQTTLQSKQGFVSDQTALNYLLAGGESDKDYVEKYGVTVFNSVNGFPGNPGRRHKRFSKTHAPITAFQVARARALISPRLRQHTKLVVQNRLNAYPWWGNVRARTIPNKPGPIVHFVGAWKDMIYDFARDGIPTA